MNGNCTVENVEYKYVVSATEKEHVYINVAEGDWKHCYYNLTMSFINQKHKNDISLSAFLLDHKKSIKKFLTLHGRF